MTVGMETEMNTEPMTSILIVECMQEISSFNPVQSNYELFHIERGEELFQHRGRNTAIGGALAVLEKQNHIKIIPTMAARADSAGILSSQGWQRLSSELLLSVRQNIDKADAVYVSLHGAMGAIGEADPEGELLAQIRAIAGKDRPIVISLDLHGILTEKMIRQVDGITIYHTYPHVDFADTGMRAASLLLDRLAARKPAAIVRTTILALVRGDELITETGFYGELIRECKKLEADGTVLAAGIMIGNPFTDAPELCTQVVLVTENETQGQELANQLASRFWQQRERMQGRLISLPDAIEQARSIKGSVVFTDAADATSSGASGDSNAILKALQQAQYEGRVLAQIVDPEVAAAAHQAGVNSTITVSIGGKMDAVRFTPMQVTAKVKLLSDGRTKLETMKTPLNGGLSAVLEFDNFTVVVLSLPAMLFDRALYYSNGLNPADFDLIVVKSPHTEHHMYDAWVARNFNIDAPGSTSADLKSLGHTTCQRPMFPLDPLTDFSPEAKIYRRG